MILTRDIVNSQIVQRLPNKLRVIAVGEWDGTTQAVTVCELKWLKLYNRFNDGSTVLESSGNNLLIETDAPITVGQFLYLPIPPFFDGTPYTTIEEWHKFSTREKDKLPFIWLVSPRQDKMQGYKSPFERLSALKIYFVHWANWNKLNNDRNSESIQPLQNLIDAFIHAINANKRVFDRLTDEGVRKEYPKFGNETVQGVVTVVQNSTLAAVELSVEVKIKKEACVPCSLE